MQIVIDCPECKAELHVEAVLAGKEGECPKCGGDLSIPPIRLGPGIIIGGFYLEKHLGKGSMGDVYLGTQISMHRKVAIKVLPPSMTVDLKAVERFLHEVKMSAKLEHANIVTAFDAGQDGETYFLAMSYIDGDTLDQLIEADGIFKEKRALEIMRKVSEGLSYAWEEHQLLHRDVKPANIMIDRHGSIKLMDMGIAKSVHEDSTLTMPGLVFGTPQYMSPEQAWSDDPIDFRADLYSVGATLYRLVTGKPPYQGTSQAVFAMLVKPEPFPPPRTLKSDLSENCAYLIEAMMASDPARRHASWQELLDDMDRVIAGNPPNLMPLPRIEDAVPADESADAKDDIDLSLAAKAPEEEKEEEGEEEGEEAAPAEGFGLDRPAVIATGDKPKIGLKKDAKDEPALALKEKPEAMQLKLPATLPGLGEPIPEEPTPPEPAPAETVEAADEPEKVRLAVAAKEEPADEPDDEAREEAAPAGSGIPWGKVLIGFTLILVLGALGGGALALIQAKGLFFWQKPAPPTPAPGPGVPTSTRPTLDPIDVPPEIPGQLDPPPVKVPDTPTTNTTDPPSPKTLAPPEPHVLVRLRKMIDLRFEKELAKRRPDEKKIAESLSLSWPVRPPAMTRGQVEAALAAKVEEVVSRKYPKRDYDKEAREKYRLFKIGEEVTVTMRGGAGAHSKVTANLWAIEKAYILVGDQKFLKSDLDDTTRARLDPLLVKKAIEKYIEIQLAQYEKPRQKYLEAARERYASDLFGSKGFTLVNKEWAPKRTVFEEAVAKAKEDLKQQEPAIREKVEREVFIAGGYVFRDGQWLK